MKKIPETQISLETVDIDSIRIDPRNPREHSDRQIKQLAQSVGSFGPITPPIVDKDNKLLAGHGRLRAYRKLGLKDIQVLRVAHMTEEEAEAFSLADNRIAEAATWNDLFLGEKLLNLSNRELDFGVEATGFSVGEIDVLIEKLSASPEDAPDPVDQMAGVTDGPPVSQPGDLWVLGGKHRVLCANSLAGPSWHALMQGARAHVIFTDPPFNVRIHGHASGNGRIHHREFAMASGEMSEAEFAAFLTQIFGWMTLHSHPGSIHFVCMDWRHAPEILMAGRAAYAELKNICVWVKDNGGMGSLYRSQHEFVFVFKHGTAPHRNNVELGKNGRYRTNVWEYPGAKTFSRQGDEGNLMALHPTVKPVQMVADALLDCSARGDVVVDPFLGSGSTLIAAERTGRVCYGIEIDSRYADTAIRRWQKFTGDVAIHATTGRTFDDIAAEMGGAA